MQLSGFVSDVAHDAPHRELVAMGDVRLTYGQVSDRAAKVAAALGAERLQPQDRVAVLSRSTPELFEIIIGSDLARTVVVALNWRLAREEMQAVIADSGASVLFASEQFRNDAVWLMEHVDCVRRVIVLGSEYEAWLAGPNAAAVASPSGVPSDVVLQLYTSGTTGRPKGVMATNHAAAFTLPKVAAAWGFSDQTVALVPMPLFHIGGIGWSLVAMRAGGRLVLLDAPSAAEILDAIEREGVTDIMVVPAQLTPLCDELERRPRDLSSLRLVTYAASPISETLLRRTIETFGCDLRQIYGQTECFGPVCQLEPEDHDLADGAGRLASCGRPVPWVELGIFDPISGEPVPDGSRGEVWTRSEQNMVGYWRQPERTADTIREDGWLRTGDIAEMRDGYVYLVDRLNDLIISGGENVFPAEVERVLLQHPAVRDAGIVGVPHDRWGETPVAAVVPHSDAKPTEAELIEFCREHLAHFKCPTSVRFVSEIPRNPTGKILRSSLHEQITNLEG